MKNDIKKRNLSTPVCKIVALAVAASFVLAGCTSSTTGSSGRGGAGSSTAEVTEAESEMTEAIEAVSEVTEATQATEAASETEAVAYEIPADFCEGYTKADYATYTAADKEKGDKVWLKGTAVQSGTIEDGDVYDFFFVVKDADGNQWLLVIDRTDSESETKSYEDDYNKNGIAVAGIYMGLTEKNVPVIVANKWFTAYDGSVHTSEAFGDAVYTGENTAGSSSEAATGSASSDSASSDSGSKRTGISDDFKKAMDEYEEFFDEYADFVKSYDATDTKQLAKYLKFLEQYTETMEAFEAWEDEDMTDEEALYYAEVSLRINKKLLEAAQ